MADDDRAPGRPLPPGTGEDVPQLYEPGTTMPWGKTPDDRILFLRGSRMKCGELVLEMETPKARDMMLEGLRLIRCNGSQVFIRKLDKMKEKGFR